LDGTQAAATGENECSFGIRASHGKKVGRCVVVKLTGLEANEFPYCWPHEPTGCCAMLAHVV